MQRDALKHLKALAEGLSGNERLQMQVLVLEYILITYPDLDSSRLQAELHKARYLELEAKVGTIAETLIAEGEARGKASCLIQFLERRFGPLPEPSKAKIMKASVVSLMKWIDCVCLMRRVLKPFLAIFIKRLTLKPGRTPDLIYSMFSCNECCFGSIVHVKLAKQVFCIKFYRWFLKTKIARNAIICLSTCNPT